MTEDLQFYLDLVKNGDMVEGYAAAITTFREKCGPEWLREFKKKNPLMSVIVDLAANYDGAEALGRFHDEVYNRCENNTEKTMAKLFMWMNEKTILGIHQRLKEEVDKPR